MGAGYIILREQGWVVQSSIDTNPGLTLNKLRVNPGLALI